MLPVPNAAGPAEARLRPVVALSVAGALLVGLATGCDTPSSNDESSEPTRSATDEPPSHAREIRMALPDDVIRGICLAHNWEQGGKDGYGSAESAATLDHLAELGATGISLTPFGWMANLESPRVRGEHQTDLPEGGESRRRLRSVTRQAHRRGLSVVLKPHIWIRGGKWRGDIEPRRGGAPAWKAWWESYRAFILHYAKMAAELEVETLVVGVELASAIEARPKEFRATIRAARSAYDGRITYAANWNENLPDRLWRRLDSVGVQFYPPLTDEPSPSVASLRRALDRRLAPWQERARRLNRPLELLEVGYKSASTAVEKPFGWPQDLDADRRETAPKLQKRAYRALFAELGELSNLRSLYIWKYFTNPNRDHGGALGFSPRKKPAEKVLRRAFGSRR